jgi:hypothetical protein
MLRAVDPDLASQELRGRREALSTYPLGRLKHQVFERDGAYSTHWASSKYCAPNVFALFI